MGSSPHDGERTWISIVNEHGVNPHLIHMLAMHLDIVDGSGNVEDGDAENGCGAGLA